MRVSLSLTRMKGGWVLCQFIFEIIPHQFRKAGNKLAVGWFPGSLPHRTAKIFIKKSKISAFKGQLNGCADIVFGALIVGIAKATLIVLQDGMVIDTIINTMANMLTGLPAGVAAQGMLLIQTLINFIIPSGSGQATTIIPIMAPLGDLMGISREMTVLTFQMGDGFSNLLWPTANIAIGCGISGVPLSKWWKFFLPLFGAIYAVQMLMLVFVQLFMGF